MSSLTVSIVRELVEIPPTGHRKACFSGTPADLIMQRIRNKRLISYRRFSRTESDGIVRAFVWVSSPNKNLAEIGLSC